MTFIKWLRVFQPTFVSLMMIVVGFLPQTQGFTTQSFRPVSYNVVDRTLLPESSARKTTITAAQAQRYKQQQHFTATRRTVVRMSSSSMSSPTSVSSNEDLIPGIMKIDATNDEFCGRLQELRDQPYFRLYSVDILASCEYLPQDLFECYTSTCEIYPVDEEDIPEDIRAVDFQEHEFELDGWARWDMPSDDYFDLQQFPEAYTGYDGSEVWKFIHEKICFDGYGYDDNQWKADFNKAVSGLHSMISLQVINGIQEKINAREEFTEEEIWQDPIVEFNRRLSPNGSTPLAIENLYFGYMLMLSAASKCRERLMNECRNGNMMSADVEQKLQTLLSYPLLDDPAVGVASRRLQEHIQNIDVTGTRWEARMRSRELLRIMNCVQCNKCRLHGKVSVLGLTTAFQLLMGKEGKVSDPMELHRVQLSALMTTLNKFSSAIQICRQLMALTTTK